MADEAKAEPVSASTQGALAEMPVAVVAAHVTGNHMQASDVPSLIAVVDTSLDRLARPPEPEVIRAKLIPLAPIRITVTDQHIISLDDGKPYQVLKRHLTKLGLTPETHREKWGLAHDYLMASPATCGHDRDWSSRWVSSACAERGETRRELEAGLRQTRGRLGLFPSPHTLRDPRSHGPAADRY